MTDRQLLARKRWSAALALLCVILGIFLIVFRGEVIRLFAEFGRYLGYPFIRRALVAGLSVSVCAALLGVSLVLKRYSMIGDGLSHVGFGALAIATALGSVPAGSAWHGLAAWISQRPMAFTTVVVVFLAFLLLKLNSSSRIRGDAAIALLSTGALALGVVVVSAAKGINIDITNYLFGSILSVSAGDAKAAAGVSLMVALLFAAAYRRLFAVTFDETFARATGTRASLYNMLLALLTAVTVVMGMRLMGTMLISSVIIFPALTAMRVFARFLQVAVSAAIISAACFVIGLMLSCVYGLPTGAGVVMVNIAAFGLFHFIGKARGIQ
jgi:ABC-type Mn2+/Zn2+ transport system permease subunit